MRRSLPQNKSRIPQAELATGANIPIEWLQKGLRLAYFIVPDRKTAILILIASIKRLPGEDRQEQKRMRWRERYMKRKFTAMVRDRGDILQWLILCEATPYERKQERSGTQNMADMVVRYLKYLMQITTCKTSVYVNVAVQRIIYNYSTPEMQQVYEWMTAHRPQRSEYREIKRVLMKQIANRFGSQLSICFATRGERRFETLNRQGEWSALVERSLALFIPWSTQQTCATSTSRKVRSEISFSTKPYNSNATDIIEMRRCHSFIHPKCYKRLIKQFGLDSPRRRQAIPKFLKAKSRETGSSQRRYEDCQDLTEDELRKVISHLQ